MRSLSNVFAIAVLLFTFSFNANAQREAGERPARPEPTEMAAKQTADMTEKLNLDEGQALKVEAINLEYAEKINAARESNKGDREMMKAIRVEYEAGKAAELKKILTEEQFATFKTMQPKRRGKKGGKAMKAADRTERG